MTSRDRFLDAAVGPLADNAELQLAARHQLEAEIPAEATEAELEEAAARLERGGSGRWRWVWAAVVVAVSLTTGLPPARKLVAAWLGVRQIASLSGIPSPDPSIGRSLSGADRLLMFGDRSAVDDDDRWRPLWESEPDNPMFYIEYALACASERRELPEDFLETGEEIDPGNGWFALKAAATGAETVVEKENLSSRDRRAGKKETWTVHDEDEFARRVALLKQGAMAERIESYQGELAELRFSKLPRPRELQESVAVIAYLAGAQIDLQEMHLADLIGAEARRCERDGDREGFRELAAAWDRFFGARLDGARVLVEGLVVSASLGRTLPAMSDAATALEVDADRWKSRAERWQARKDERETASDAELEQRVTRHGSMLTALSLPMVSRQVLAPPAVTEADLLPATRVEQALLGRGLAGAGWLLLGLFASGSWLAGRFQSPLTRRTAEGLGGLFRLRDALWIGVAGVAAPLVIYLLLRYATPLGRLDWGPRLTFYAVPLAHFVGLLLMALVWPAGVALWRAASAGRVLGWKRPGLWTALAMAMPVAGMLCFSFAVPPGSASMPLAIAGTACGAWALAWWFTGGFLSTSGRWEVRVRRQVVARAARPAWVGSMLAMAGLVAFFHAEERRWFARDVMIRPCASFTAYEAKVTEQLKRELREILE